MAPKFEHLPIKNEERFQVFGTPAADVVKSECGFVEVSETKGVSKMTQERQKRGNPYKRGDTWTIDYSFEDPATGKKIRKRKGGFATKKEAEKALAIKKARILQGDLSDEITNEEVEEVLDEITFSEFSEKWLESKKPNIAYNTYIGYSSVLNNYILPTLGPRHMADITRKEIQNLIDTKPAPSSVERCRLIIGYIFKEAIIEGIVDNNPCQYLTQRSYKSQKRPSLSVEQAIKLLEASKEYRNSLEPYVVFGLYLGLRYGEISALKYSDFNFNTHEVLVNKQIARISTGEYGETVPKTQKSIRRIYLPPNVEVYVKDRKKELIDNGFLGDTYVVSTVYGEVPNWCSQHVIINSLIKELTRSLGFKQITLHSLRHTCATILIQSGIPMKKVSDMLGHSNISTTLDIYCDVLQGEKDIAMAMQSIISSNDTMCSM